MPTRILSTALASGAAAPPTRLLPLGGLEAVEALKAGKVDAIFLVGPGTSGAVWASFYAEGFRLMSFAHADAYVRRWPYLSKLALPRGGIDLVRDIPGRDVTLIAYGGTVGKSLDAATALAARATTVRVSAGLVLSIVCSVVRRSLPTTSGVRRPRSPRTRVIAASSFWWSSSLSAVRLAYVTF